MKLYTLGTSHGHAEPHRGCSGTLLCVDDAYYLFDCGGDVEGRMADLGLPMERLKAVFVSHMHEDHAASLSSIVKRFTVYFHREIPVELLLPEQNGVDALIGWCRVLHLEPCDGRLRYTVTQAGECYHDDCLTVRAIPTAHIQNGRYPSFAYDVSVAGKRLLYTGDLAADLHDYPRVVTEEPFDVIISEGTHFDVNHCLDTLLRTQTKRMIFTHLYPTTQALLPQHMDRFPFRGQLAEDGMLFEL